MAHVECGSRDLHGLERRALTILTAAVVLAAGNAWAQTYDRAFPFCMHVVSPRGGTYQDCTYYTMAQCAASASGRGLQCNPNPFYAGPTALVRRNSRRHRQVGSISPAPAGTVQDRYCLQGRSWGYPGNCQFSSYAQCMATRAVLLPIVGSIPSTCSRTSGAATIGLDTERPTYPLARTSKHSVVLRA